MMEIEGTKFDDVNLRGHDESKYFKYEKLHDETKQASIRRPSLKESVLSSHFSHSRIADKKICLEWQNVYYSTLVKGIDVVICCPYSFNFSI